MTNDTLKEFYNYLAFGEFDKALEMAEKSMPDSDEQERIIIQALRVKRLLKNISCHNSV